MNLFSQALILILIAACANSPKSMENRDLEQLYQGAGVERYFLADLPGWANFSSSSHCRRDGLVRYLNFETIKSSYAMGYEESVHMQHMINRRFVTTKSNSERQLYLKDEAFIFYNVFEQVAGGGRDFLLPRFDRVSLIFLDPYLNDLSRVKTVLNRRDVGQGHPILVSACLNSYSMEKLSEKEGWDSFGVKLIGQEMFTPYDSNGNLGHEFGLDFSKFMPGKKIILFSPVEAPHLKGSNKIIKL